MPARWLPYYEGGVGGISLPHIAATTQLFTPYGWVTIADSVTLSDARSISRNLAVDDAVALADDLKRGQTFADTVTVTDSFSRVVTQSITIADTVAVSDQPPQLENTDGTDHELFLGDEVAVTDARSIQHGLPRRITQSPVEVLAKPTNAKVRITQSPVEVLAQGESKYRATQYPVEVLVQSNVAYGRFTQSPVEVLITNTREFVCVVIID